MIKDAKFPSIKTADLAMHPKVIDSRLMKRDMNFSKADDKNVKAKLKEVDFRLKKAGYPGKIKVVNDVFQGSLDH